VGRARPCALGGLSVSQRCLGIRKRSTNTKGDACSTRSQTAPLFCSARAQRKWVKRARALHAASPQTSNRNVGVHRAHNLSRERKITGLSWPLAEAGRSSRAIKRYAGVLVGLMHFKAPRCPREEEGVISPRGKEGNRRPEKSQSKMTFHYDKVN